ncbi:MAG TPA: cytochrome c biogenesis CcdA family protein, partial [Elusimicrobiota bacterium]|nr:cytochrome c biogenesis CcdA family protein [Elusimicrobiota bacterium]
LTGLQEAGSRRLVLAHAACFIAGFSLVFIALGASASLLGSLLFRYRSVIERLGGLVLSVLGLWMLGAFQATFLYKDARFHFREKPAGYAGSAVVGAAFAAGWTPCVGPALASILLLASQEGSVTKGVALLAVYSAGFALPLLLCAVAMERATRVLNRIKPALPAIERATGALILLLGLAMAAGWYSRVSAWTLARFGRL